MSKRTPNEIIDAILDKINKKGKKSLTSQEKEFLEKYNNGEDPQDWKSYLHPYYQKLYDDKLQDLAKLLDKVNIKYEIVDSSDYGLHSDAHDAIEIKKQGAIINVGWDIKGYVFAFPAPDDNQTIAFKILNFITDYEETHSISEHQIPLKDTYELIVKILKTDFSRPDKLTEEEEELISLGFIKTPINQFVYYLQGEGLSYFSIPKKNLYSFVYTIWDAVPLISFKSFKEFVDHFKKYTEGKYDNVDDAVKIFPDYNRPSDEYTKKILSKFGKPYINLGDTEPFSLNEVRRLQKIAGIKINTKK